MNASVFQPFREMLLRYKHATGVTGAVMDELADTLTKAEQLAEDAEVSAAKKREEMILAMGGMWLALNNCAGVFSIYEASHRAKGTEEGDEKAARNAAMKDLCMRACQGFDAPSWDLADMFWSADDPVEARGSVSDLFGYGDLEPGEVHEVQAAVSLENFFVLLPRGEAVEAPLVFLTKEAAEAARAAMETEELERAAGVDGLKGTKT